MSLQDKQIERQGATVVPTSKAYPKVLGGVCEYCGIVDKEFNGPQYKLCPHYRGRNLWCTYCPNDDHHQPEDVVKRSVMKIYDHPQDASKLIVVCDETQCMDKHWKKWVTAN